MKVEIGSVQDFMGGQKSKVEQRAEEERQIKKGIYQMKAAIASQTMETLMEESDKAAERKGRKPEETESTESESEKNKKTDVQTEMEKMISTAGQKAALNKLVV